MDLGPPLLPTVIAPLEVTLNGGKFTCSGDGLVKNEHKFDPNMRNYLPLLEPVRTKTGKVRFHQPDITKQPLAYWKAQCVFRGLTQGGTVSGLQDRLRSSDVGMITLLAKTEKELNKKFREKNAAIRDERWNSAESNEQKAEMDPRRFLQEFFHLDGMKESSHQGDAVVLKTVNRSILHQAADSLRLEHHSVDAPDTDGGRSRTDNRWIIISKTRSALNQKSQIISRERARMQRILEDERNERTRKLNKSITAETKKLGKEVWDVTGNWTIKCPKIESNWGNANRALTLEIHISNTSEGKQMWAEFDFNVINGIFRFINPASKAPTKKSSQAQASSTHSKRKRTNNKEEVENDDDDDDEEEDEDEDGGLCEQDSDNSSTPEEFILSAKDQPSPKCPMWDFRWRGEETGEGQIQLSSEKYLCSIKFYGTGGCKLTGTFEADFTERVEFTGLKIGKGRSNRSDPTDEWQRRNERQYEAARVGRWG